MEPYRHDTYHVYILRINSCRTDYYTYSLVVRFDGLSPTDGGKITLVVELSDSRPITSSCPEDICTSHVEKSLCCRRSKKLREKLRHDHDSVRQEDIAPISDSELDKMVESELYYRRSFFRQRVPRRVLPPSKLYHRTVRSVFEFYGAQIDNKSKLPLFSKDKWAKANNVLSDILRIRFRSSRGFLLNRSSQ